MINHNNLPCIGIVGCGPRGLSALESLFKNASLSKQQVKALVFEETDQPGAGPVYDTGQPDTNWLNVAERAVDIWGRDETEFGDFTIPAFPPYQEWIGHNRKNHSALEPDYFPPRARMGQYLRERYESMANVLEKQGLMTRIHGKIIGAKVGKTRILLEVLGGKSYDVDEAVLAIGHQPIQLDGQLRSWQSVSLQMDGPTLFTDPYPIDSILESDVLAKNGRIGVRGFGLAMIDVARALSIGRGGKFKLVDKDTRRMEYMASGNEPIRIVPFSLDGLPMAPKPLNLKIDRPYVPSNEDKEQYSNTVETALSDADSIKSTEFLIQAFSPLVARIYCSPKMDRLDMMLDTKDVRDLTIAWLRDDNFTHRAILPKDMNVVEMMERFCAMATGNGKVSLDYCIGHVWRHCQPTMYKLLSFASLNDVIIAKIVALDERLKRYSYGPPIDSLQQLLALERTGILDLSFVKAPDIDLNEAGWSLKVAKNEITVETMINSVLDSPQILKAAEPLPKGLINGADVEPLHDKLGIRTKQDALVEFENRDASYPLSVLGRLAKGTLIGVDAIAECFGVRSELWAQGVIARLGKGTVTEEGEVMDNAKEPL